MLKLKEEVEFETLLKYGFVHEPDNMEWNRNCPRYAYYPDGVKRGNQKPLITIYENDYRLVMMEFSTTYLRRAIPSIIMDLIKADLLIK